MAREEGPVVCARCIADGSLSVWLGDEDFALVGADVWEARPDYEDEILHRTPGFPTFQHFVWPVVDGEPLAFIGHGDDERLFASLEIRTAIAAELEKVGEVLDGPTPYALIFRRLDGSAYHVEMDYD